MSVSVFPHHSFPVFLLLSTAVIFAVCYWCVTWVHAVPSLTSSWQKTLNQAVFLPGLCLFLVLLPWCPRVFSSFTLTWDQNLEPQNLRQKWSCSHGPKESPQGCLWCIWSCSPGITGLLGLSVCRVMGFVSLLLQKAAETDLNARC